MDAEKPPERTFFKKILGEARTKEDPQAWLKQLRAMLNLRKMSELQLREIMEVATEGLPLSNPAQSVELRHLDVIATSDFKTLFHPTLTLEKEPSFSVTDLSMVAACADAESFHQAILDREKSASIEARAVVLFTEGKPIAYMKRAGAYSVLSFETVTSPKGDVLLARGMLYALHPKLRHLLENIVLKDLPRGAWVGIDIEDIREADIPVTFTPVRLIANPDIIKLLAERSDEFKISPPAHLRFSSENLFNLANGKELNAHDYVEPAF